MNGYNTRREFILGSMAALATAGCRVPCCGYGPKFKLAMAGYTMHTLKVREALELCQQLGVGYLCVKDFHLPFTSTQAQITDFRRMCEDHGVTPYGVGPIYMCDKDHLRRYFDYASALGVDLIVGVPGIVTGPRWQDKRSDRGMCEKVSGLADEYGIRYAIHNHGRNPKTGVPTLYPAVPETMELIGDLSPRMGLCVDWAYTHADGLNCREIALKYRDRIFDCHIRCIADVHNGSSGTNPATRAFDYDDIFAALKEIGYEGCLGLELAAAFPDNRQWLGESYEYFRGLM